MPLALCRKALERYRTLNASDPTNAQGRNDLAAGYEALARVLAQRGEWAAAAAELERTVGLREATLASEPGNVPNRRRLAFALLELGLARARAIGAAGAPPGADAWPAALAAYRRAQEVLLPGDGRPLTSAEDEDRLRAAAEELARLAAGSSASFMASPR